MAMSNAERKEIDRLFDCDEFIPPEILTAVRKSLFIARRTHKWSHESFRDLIQNTLKEIWGLERKFTSKPPKYFAGVAKKTAINYFRKEVKWSRHDTKPEEFFSFNEIEMMNEALTQMYSKIDLEALMGAVLSDEERAVVKLRFYRRLTLKLISVRLKLSQATVKRRHSDALQKLRSSLRLVAFRKV